MNHLPRAVAALFVAFLVNSCGPVASPPDGGTGGGGNKDGGATGGGTTGGGATGGGTSARGQLVGTPTMTFTGTQQVFQGVIATFKDTATAPLFKATGDAKCGVTAYSYRFQTAGGKGEPTQSSGAIFVPSGTGADCTGARPVVLYAHGTTIRKDYNLAFSLDKLATNDGAQEGALVAAVFAAQGYIVVAPNYAGYDISTLGYHPFLNAVQQSGEMVDSLAAARTYLADAGIASPSSQLFITGYSQGGHVAMATQRAIEATGATVTAAATLSGPYALSAFGDSVFFGEVPQAATVFAPLLAVSYQRAYGNIYAAPSDLFAAPYAAGIETLLPTTRSLQDLYSTFSIPLSWLFDTTPPDPAYASYTPSTNPPPFPGLYALGFYPDAGLITNAYRLRYLQDALAQPDLALVDGGVVDGGTTGLPSAPDAGLRQALKLNDLRYSAGSTPWKPAAPLLICGGNRDPVVPYAHNAVVISNYFTGLGVTAATMTLLDVDVQHGTYDAGSPFGGAKQAFESALVQAELDGGQALVQANYHGRIAYVGCMAAASQFFGPYITK